METWHWSLLHNNIDCKLLNDNHVWTDYSTQKYGQSTSEWSTNSMLPLFHVKFPMSFEFPDDRYFNSHLVPWQCLIITGCLNEHCKSLSPPPRDSTLRGTKQVMVVVVYHPSKAMFAHRGASSTLDPKWYFISGFQDEWRQGINLVFLFCPLLHIQKGSSQATLGGG